MKFFIVLCLQSIQIKNYKIKKNIFSDFLMKNKKKLIYKSLAAS